MFVFLWARQREAADAMLADCLTDEPEWADVLSVERIELAAGSLN